jgi:hypothetical protein
MKRRDWGIIEYSVDIDEFIRSAKRWDKLRVRLIITLTRLPIEAYDFVVKNVSFHAGQSQMMVVKEFSKPYMVILKRTDSQSEIAHEIAHAYLCHNRQQSTKENIEDETEKLRRKWGFKAKSSCPDYPNECSDCKNPNCTESSSFLSSRKSH